MSFSLELLLLATNVGHWEWLLGAPNLFPNNVRHFWSLYLSSLSNVFDIWPNFQIYFLAATTLSSPHAEMQVTVIWSSKSFLSDDLIKSPTKLSGHLESYDDMMKKRACHRYLISYKRDDTLYLVLELLHCLSQARREIPQSQFQPIIKFNTNYQPINKSIEKTNKQTNTININL